VFQRRLGTANGLLRMQQEPMSITSALPTMLFWSAYKPYFMITLSSPPVCPMVERIQFELFLNRHPRTPATAILRRDAIDQSRKLISHDASLLMDNTRNRMTNHSVF